nr:MAG TPA: hypothetical protein [Caudoviricetes sp.]
MPVRWQGASPNRWYRCDCDSFENVYHNHITLCLTDLC